MTIRSIMTGDMGVNTYLITEGKEAVMIDPSADAAKLINILHTDALTLKYILITHGHFDHIGAVSEIKDVTGAKIAIAEEDAAALHDDRKSLAMYSGIAILPSQADILLADGDEIPALGETIRVMATPGHSEGSVCFLLGNMLFTGDTLFRESVGRSDFPGSDTRELTKSLKRLSDLPGDYDVYPGHGPATTLDYEREHNFFLSRV